jgi:hypothetical protein
MVRTLKDAIACKPYAASHPTLLVRLSSPQAMSAFGAKETPLVREWFAHPQSEAHLVACLGLLPAPPETSDSPPATPPRLLATAGESLETIRVWDLDAQRMVTELEMGGGSWRMITYEVAGAFRIAAGGNDGVVSLYDGHTYEHVASTDPLSDSVSLLKVWTDSATGAALLIALAWNGGGMVVRSDAFYSPV